jgi:hypothetical protein
VVNNVQVVLIPVPCAGTTHWRVPPKPQYPRETRDRRAAKTPPPIDRQAIERLLNDARRRLCEDRASRLLRQLDR